MVQKKNPIKLKSIKIKIPKSKILRLPRGPTVRWDINYGKLFKKKK